MERQVQVVEVPVRYDDVCLPGISDAERAASLQLVQAPKPCVSEKREALIEALKRLLPFIYGCCHSLSPDLTEESLDKRSSGKPGTVLPDDQLGKDSSVSSAIGHFGESYYDANPKIYWRFTCAYRERESSKFDEANSTARSVCVSEIELPAVEWRWEHLLCADQSTKRYEGSHPLLLRPGSLPAESQEVSQADSKGVTEMLLAEI